MKTSHPPFSSLPQPWDRIVPHIAIVMVWGLLFGLVFLLRSFFLLLFLTFVFSTIQANGVARLDKFIKNRIFRVILVEILFLAVLSMVGVFLVPKVKVQTELFMSQFPSYLERVDQEIHELSLNYPLLAEILPELVVEAPENDKKAVETNGIEYSPSRSMLQQLLKVGEESGGIENVNHVLGTLGNIGGQNCRCDLNVSSFNIVFFSDPSRSAEIGGKRSGVGKHQTSLHLPECCR